MLSLASGRLAPASGAAGNVASAHDAHGMHCLGAGMVEADGVYGRVVGCRLVAMSAGRFVQAPLHCAAAQMLRPASRLPRCARWWRLRAARLIRRLLAGC